MKSIYRVIALLVLSLLFVGTALFANTTLASQLETESKTPAQHHDGDEEHDEEEDEEQEEDEEGNEAHVPPGVTFQDEKAAQAADIAILAKETGLPVKSVESAIVFQQAFGEYADELLVRYPDQISAVWTEPVPSTRGHIQFVGDVPSEVTAEVEKRGQRNQVLLTGKGMISMADHYRRAELAAEALVDLKYQNFVTFFDPMNNVIRIEIQLPERTKQPTERDIVRAVQNRIQDRLQGRAAIVDVNDLELTVLTGSGPIVTLAHSRGGNQLLDDGVRECTSGWSVSGPNGDGIITAGHCNGLNQFEEPGVAPYSMSWKSQVFGSQGDVEYHTTSHIEYDDFYADSTTIRDVRDIRTTATMPGNSVCMYGRASNVRTCNHTVEAVNLTVNVDGTSVGKQARATNNSMILGDSGGGWSTSSTAWGISTGFGTSNGKSYFTPAQQAQSALGVTIKR